MANKIYMGDIGLEIIIDMQEDINGAATHEMLVLKNGIEVTWAASIYNDRYLRYVTVANDLDVVGTYFIQGNFVFPSGWSGVGETVNFVVNKKWS